MLNTNAQQDYLKAINILKMMYNNHAFLYQYTKDPSTFDVMKTCHSKLEKLENTLNNNSSDSLPNLSSFNLNEATTFSENWDAQEAEEKKQKQYDHLLNV